MILYCFVAMASEFHAYRLWIKLFGHLRVQSDTATAS